MPEPFYTEPKPAAAPFDMVFVAGGSFLMGDNDPAAYDNEKPVHTVTVPDFYIGKYPVTQALWKAVLDGDDPSHFKGDTRPVEQVSWNDIIDRFLPALQRITNNPYRLPTEAEWEYAARGGAQAEGYMYAGSDKLTEIGWFHENSSGETHEVGLLYPNELGIYDFSGNVSEWAEDHWYDDYMDAPADGSAWILRDKGAPRLYRGGSWAGNARDCRVSCRHQRYVPGYWKQNLGFRLACSPWISG